MLDEARDAVAGYRQLQYEVPMATARAEVHLLEGQPQAAVSELSEAYEDARRLESQEYLATLGLWLWRSGARTEPVPIDDRPEVLAVHGRHRAAADKWFSYGLDYAAAWALLDSNDELSLLEARRVFDRLGATVLVARTDEKLRAIGGRVLRGPRPTTRSNIGGLTDREIEVLALVDEGLRNADIAARLHLSEKTVGHHVSAILGKLGVATRQQAVRRARELVAS